MPVLQKDLDESVAKVEADEESRFVPVVNTDRDESVAEAEAGEENRAMPVVKSDEDESAGGSSMAAGMGASWVELKAHSAAEQKDTCSEVEADEGNIKVHGSASGSSSMANRRRMIGMKRSWVGLNAGSRGLKGVLSLADEVDGDEEYMHMRVVAVMVNNNRNESAIRSVANQRAIVGGSIQTLKHFLSGSFRTLKRFLSSSPNVSRATPSIRICVPNVEDAVSFYKREFGAKEDCTDQVIKDFPYTIELNIQGTAFFILERPHMGKISGIQNYHCLVVENTYATVGRLLSAGAVLYEEIVDYGDARHGSVVDPYGVLWYILDRM